MSFSQPLPLTSLTLNNGCPIDSHSGRPIDSHSASIAIRPRITIRPIGRRISETRPRSDRSRHTAHLIGVAIRPKFSYSPLVAIIGRH